MQTRVSLRLSLVAACAGLALAGAVQAAPILGASSSASVTAGPATPSTYTEPGYTGSYSYATDAEGNASGNGFAKSNGAYAVGSNAQGKGKSAGTASIQTSVTNNSGVAQQYAMSFYIYGGSINSYMNYGALGAGEFATASFLASIKVNNTVAFSAGGTVFRNEAGTSGSLTGTDLSNGGNDVTDGDFFWGGQYHTIDLGVIAAGATVDVLAELSQQSESNVGTYTYTYDVGCCNSYGDGYGYGGCEFNFPTLALATFNVEVPVDGECNQTQTGFKAGANGFYGDPFTFTGSPQGGTGASTVLNQLNITSTPVPQAVPEPGALGLAALGLLAAGAAGQRRRQR